MPSVEILYLTESSNFMLKISNLSQFPKCNIDICLNLKFEF